MATKPTTIEFLLDQLSGVGDVTARKMFGEYALYSKGRVVALVCDDTLFVKMTEPGKNFVGSGYQEGAPYPGAKPSLRIDDDKLDDAEWLCQLVRITADNVPLPQPKKAKLRLPK